MQSLNEREKYYRKVLWGVIAIPIVIMLYMFFYVGCVMMCAS